MKTSTAILVISSRGRFLLGDAISSTDITAQTLQRRHYSDHDDVFLGRNFAQRKNTSVKTWEALEIQEIQQIRSVVIPQ